MPQDAAITEPPARLEQLDRALYVTTPKAWLALAMLMAIAGAVVFWAFAGETASYVRGKGILLSRSGTVFDAASPEGGRLIRMVPSLGDQVGKGEVLAEIENAETMERHANALDLLGERRRALRDREAEVDAENALINENMVNQRANLDLLERTGRELIETTRNRHRNNLTLFEDGLIARTEVEASEEAVDLARRNLFDVTRRREELDSIDIRRRNDLRIRLSEAEAELLAAQRAAREIETLIETWRIRAPVSGRVTEVKAQVGTVLEPGQSVLAIETGGDTLDVLIYVPPTDGKRVEAGMPARISPNTVRHVEYGYITGVVESISDFPASIDSMTAVLQNQELAMTLSSSGPAYSGRILLTPDPTTASGFAWTSPKGAGVEITVGTLADIEIEVDRQPPISLVVPLIKEGLGY